MRHPNRNVLTERNTESRYVHNLVVSLLQFSTQQLHRAILPETDFAADVFDTVFNDVDRDADGVLSCQELELLYYMYSTRIMECM